MSIVDLRVAGRVVVRFWGVARVLLWRVVVAAVGFVVAWRVGWRLSGEDTVLVVLFAWLPLALWCAVAPRVWWAVPIGLGLLALIGTVRWTLPGVPGDRSRAVALSVLMWYVLPGTAALLLGAFGFGRDRWLRRRRGPGAVRHPGCAVRVGGRYRGRQSPSSGRRAGDQDPASDSPVPASRGTWLSRVSVAAAVVTFTLGCCCPGGLFAVFGKTAPGPSDAELFPLPSGMHATSDDGLDGPSGCDLTGHACWLSYRITGSPTESVADLNIRLTRHLQTAKGWQPMLPCRRVFVFGQRMDLKICVDIKDNPATTAGRPSVEVEMSIGDTYGE